MLKTKIKHFYSSFKILIFISFSNHIILFLFLLVIIIQNNSEDDATSSLGGANESMIVWPKYGTWSRSIRLPISPMQSSANMCCQSERGRWASCINFCTRLRASLTGCVMTKDATAWATEWCAVLCRPCFSASLIKEVSKSRYPNPEPLKKLINSFRLILYNTC